MTRAAAAARKQPKRASAIPRFGIQKTKTSPISAVVRSTLQGRKYSKKPQTKSVRFAGVRDGSLKISSKGMEEASKSISFPVKNNHIDDDFVFESDPDALASILNNDGVTREQLIKSQAAETAKKEQSADEFLLVDGRPSLCRRVPIKRAPGVLPDGRPSLLSARVSAGPARVERPSVSGRTSFMKKGSVMQSFGRDSLYSFIEQKYSQRLQHPDLESTRRRTTIASTARQNLSHGMKLKDCTNKLEMREPQRVMSTKKVAPATPAARVLVAANPVLGSPALRVRQSDKKTPVKSRLALVGSPEMKDDVVAALDFRDDENVSPNVQLKITQTKKDSRPAKSLSRLQPPSQINTRRMSGLKQPGGAVTKSRLPPRNSDRYSFIKKAPAKVTTATKLHARFAPVNLKNGEQLVEPKTLNEGKPPMIESSSKPEQTVHVKVCSPTVLNNNEPRLKNMGCAQPASASRDMNGNTIIQSSASKVTKMALKSPNGYVAPPSRVKAKKITLDADTVLEMMKRKLKTIKRKSMQNEFCSIMKSMETEMSLASVVEKPEVEDTAETADDPAQPSGKVMQTREVEPVVSAPGMQDKPWRDILKSDKSPTWKAILGKESHTKVDRVEANVHERSGTSNTEKKFEKKAASPTWKDILKTDTCGRNVPTVAPQPSSAKTESLEKNAVGVKSFGSSQNLRRLLGTESRLDPLLTNTFKGHDYDKGIGLGVTRARFLNILSYNPTPTTRSNPVFTVNKFFDPVALDSPNEESADSSKKIEATEKSKSDCAVFKSLTSEDGKYFSDSRTDTQESCGSTADASAKSIAEAAANKTPAINHDGQATDNFADSKGLACTMQNSDTLQKPKNYESFFVSSTSSGVPNQTMIQQSKTTTQQLDNQDTTTKGLKDGRLGSRAPLNSVQWVDKMPNVSRYGTNCARVVFDKLESPESPELDFAKSVFWVEKTPAPHSNKITEKDLPHLAKSAPQESGQTENSSVKHDEKWPGIPCSANETNSGNQGRLKNRGYPTAQYGANLCEPSYKPLQSMKSHEMVNCCHEKSLLSGTSPTPTPSNSVERKTPDRKNSHDGDQSKIFDVVSWSEKCGTSKHKISSGRLGKDTNTKVEEKSTISQVDIPIVSVFSPKAASPHPSIPSTRSNESQNATSMGNSHKSHLASENVISGQKSGSPKVASSSKEISSVIHHDPSTFKRNVRFSDVVTHIACVDPDKVVNGLSISLAATNERPCSSHDGYSESAQPLDGTEPVCEKVPMHNTESFNAFNSANLDVSFLDSLHVVAIETKKDDTAKRSILPKPHPPSYLSQERLSSTSPATTPSLISSSFAGMDTRSVPCATAKKMATTHVIRSNLQPVSTTLPGFCESQISSSSANGKDFLLSETREAVTQEEKAAPPQVIPTNSQPVPSTVPETRIYQTSSLDVKTQLLSPMVVSSTLSQGKVTSSRVVQSNLQPVNGGKYQTWKFLSEDNVKDQDASVIVNNFDERAPPDSTGGKTFQNSHPISHITKDQGASSIAPSVRGQTPSNLCPTISLPDDSEPEVRNLQNVATLLPQSNGTGNMNESIRFLKGSGSQYSTASLTNPILPTFMKHDGSVAIKPRSYLATPPSALGSSPIKSTTAQVLKLTPMKLQNGFDDKDSLAKSTSTDLKSPITIVAPKPVFPPAPQTPAALRLLRRKLQESPVPKTFRSRFSPLKSAFGGVRKTPQKKVRFMSSSPYMKSLCSKRFTEALLDEEVALLTCRRFRSPGTPTKKARSRVAQNPLGKVLLDGDDLHFVPISPMDASKKTSAAAGSAFSVFKQ